MMSRQLLDVARIAAIVACVGLLYSPSVGTIGLVTAYVAFFASGTEAVARFKAVLARPLGYWGLIFLGAVSIGMLYASVPWHDRWMDLYKWRTILWLLVMLALFDEALWKERFLAVFLVGTGVAVVASSFSVVAGVPIWRGAHEVLRNSGTQGMAFACAALVCVWMILQKSHRRYRWAVSVLAALYVLNIVFITNSRSGYAVLGCGLASLLLWQSSWKQGLAISLALFVAGGLAYAASPRMQEIVMAGVTQWTTASESEVLTNFGSRRIFYQNSVELLQNSWLLGVGTGGFAQAYGDHVSKKYGASDWRALHTTDPHNQYLSVWIQQGIGGLALFLAWIVAIVRERESFRSDHRLAVAILIGWCVSSLFSSHFRTFAEGHMLAMFLGVLLAVAASSEAARPVSVTSTEA
ncbi:MAG: Putative O-antigen polymerase [Nitrospira sp.]|nr:MAG: Putative O-antigen polymerase [Nitrospira sp.]